MATSKLQRYVGEQLWVHFGKYEIRENLRPDWLITPDGARLELDFYIEELNVAIEVQGAQHYMFIPYFHGNHDAFEIQAERDTFKRERCRRMGIHLYEVACRVDLKDVMSALAEARGTDTPVFGERLPWKYHPASRDKVLRKKLEKLARSVATLRYTDEGKAEAQWDKLLELCQRYQIPVADAARLVAACKHRSYPRCENCGSRMRQSFCKNGSCEDSPLYTRSS